MHANGDRVAALIEWYRSLTPDTVAQVGEYYAEGASFRDPFNDVTGVAAIRRIFEHMFRQVEQPAFEITDWSARADTAMLVWHFSSGPAERRVGIDGATHLRFDAQGLICMHRDYWDPVAELLMQRPLLGALPRWLYRRLAA